MPEPRFIKGAEFLPQIDKTLDGFKENIYLEEEYPSVLKLLQLDRLHPDKKCEFMGLVYNTKDNVLSLGDKSHAFSNSGKGSISSKILWALIRRGDSFTSQQMLTRFLEETGRKFVPDNGGFYIDRNVDESNVIPVLITRLRKVISKLSNGKLTIANKEKIGYKISTVEEAQDLPSRGGKKYLKEK